MCLAVPAKIVALGADAQATIDMMGVQRSASLRLTPEAQVGDYVLIHAGFSIQVIDAQEAAETIELLREIEELETDELGADEAPTSAAAPTAAGAAAETPLTTCEVA